MNDQILWALAIFGIFNLGILTTISVLYKTNNLPWQHTVELYKTEASTALASAKEKDNELKQIRDTLLSSLPKNR